MSDTPKTALVPLAEGFEELEAVAVIDVLRRGGVAVTVAGLDGPEPVRGSRGVVLVPDVAFTGEEAPDLLVLVGGMGGVRRLAADPRLRALISRRHAARAPLAAICAAPLALYAADALPREFTCYPGIEAHLGAPRRDEPVVVDGHVVTSQGPGTAVAFALHLVALLAGDERRATTAAALLA